MRFTDSRGWLASVIAAAAALAGCASKPTPKPALQPVPPSSAAAPGTMPLPPARSWDEYRRRAAERLVAANPDRSYLGPVSQPLLAIPVLEVELEHDGRVRQIHVRRVPSQAKDTTQLAIDAVRRAAPFGDVSHLPRPWAFTEVFLFDDERRFKPRTLDD